MKHFLSLVLMLIILTITPQVRADFNGKIVSTGDGIAVLGRVGYTFSPEVFASQRGAVLHQVRNRYNTLSAQDKSPKSGYIAGTCKSLKAQGLGPFYKSKGDPNYTTARDRDGDGVACE